KPIPHNMTTTPTNNKNCSITLIDRLIDCTNATSREPPSARDLNETGCKPSLAAHDLIALTHVHTCRTIDGTRNRLSTTPSNTIPLQNANANATEDNSPKNHTLRGSTRHKREKAPTANG